MQQYNIENNRLVLSVKKSPLFIRIILFFFTSLFFLLPTTAFLVGSIFFGYGFHIAYLFAFVFFGLLGFYMLRVTLWNTYGEEILTIENDSLIYVANYGWFKDKVKNIKLDKPITIEIKPYHYEDDDKAKLCISTNSTELNCVTKMPFEELYEINDSEWIKKLNG
jgi:energy-coupling factor transporter transmembrane protein EcfT